jgi:hypothetical protein
MTKKTNTKTDSAKNKKQPSNNTIETPDGVEIYPNRIYELADEYEASLKDPEQLYKLSSSTFTGMIKYINIHMGWRNRNYNIKYIYSNIELLDDIWNIYVDLNYKYNQKPTITEFSIMIGCSRDTIYSWVNDETRRDSLDKLSLKRSDAVKNWLTECRLGRYKGAAAGNVGYIFLCKAVDGMTETAPVQVDTKRRALSADNLPKLSDNSAALPDDHDVIDV